jgi:hypothetical protein
MTQETQCFKQDGRPSRRLLMRHDRRQAPRRSAGVD